MNSAYMPVGNVSSGSNPLLASIWDEIYPPLKKTLYASPPLLALKSPTITIMSLGLC